jgi:hypothetical protein
MSKNAMAGAVTLCGVGLCVIGAALMMQNGNSAHAAGGMPLAAVAAVAHAQAGPTVVWYGSDTIPSTQYYFGRYYSHTVITRAWSDGRVEMMMASKFLRYNASGGGGDDHFCSADAPCVTPWFTVSDPTTGYRAAADFNADEQVNAVDLASILGNWGDAPRVPFPPSDCPLNLINP